jgi:3-methylcrotonyl-CoA carboxylase alpha subunit
VIYTLRVRDRHLPARVTPDGESLAIELDGRLHTVAISPRAGTTQFTVTIDGTAYAMGVTRSAQAVTVIVGPDRYEFAVSRGAVASRRGEAAAGAPSRHDIAAPMPGLIKSTAVAPGDSVEPGRVVVVMEAMKMQMEIRTPEAGRVIAVLARPGEEVARGAVLVTIETGTRGLGD